MIETSIWRLEVDPDMCAGTGLCIGTAPRHFVLRAGKSTPRSETIEPDDAVVDAVESCPMEALAVYDTASGQRVTPG